MPRQRKAAKPVTAGRRTGTKRRDFRWTAPDGTIWASRFEFEVFTALKEQGYAIRKTGPEDSLHYTSTTIGGRCTACGSGKVVQERVFTADLFVDTTDESGGAGNNVRTGYYLETKGYLRSTRRSLLRAFRKAQPNVDLRLIVQRDYPVGKGTLTEWATKYLKVPVCVWKGKLKYI